LPGRRSTMLSGRELYAIWAPANALWSPWVAPALFAHIVCDESRIGPGFREGVPSAAWFETQADPGTAVLIDLPGAEAFRVAMQLGGIGYRPVSLINALPQRTTLQSGQEAPPSVVLDMSEMVREICASTQTLQNLALPPSAPPAFVLDANRRSGTRPLGDEMFDNRWIVFPQDFPSARFLAEHGIRRVILLQAAGSQPQEDLAHVLLRWQEAGIPVAVKLTADAGAPVDTQVLRPRRFKAMWYRVLAAMGFHRSGTGGFGSMVPGSGSAG
jgi:hypothetical protein